VPQRLCCLELERVQHQQRQRKVVHPAAAAEVTTYSRVPNRAYIQDLDKSTANADATSMRASYCATGKACVN
jgi:hypothetical protein